MAKSLYVSCQGPKFISLDITRSSNRNTVRETGSKFWSLHSPCMCIFIASSNTGLLRKVVYNKPRCCYMLEFVHNKRSHNSSDDCYAPYISSVAPCIELGAFNAAKIIVFATSSGFICGSNPEPLSISVSTDPGAIAID